MPEDLDPQEDADGAGWESVRELLRTDRQARARLAFIIVVAALAVALALWGW